MPVPPVDADQIRQLSGPALRAFLAAEHPRASIEEIARAWRWTTISLLLEGDFRGQEGHDVARKLRGALWPVLQRHASDEARAGEPCPRRPLSLLDLLWNNHGMITRAREVPKPFVLRGHVDAETGARRAVVQMALFGLAGAFADEIVDMLHAAFGRGIGAYAKDDAWRVTGCEVEADTDVGEIPEAVDMVVLELRSPLMLKRDGNPSADWRGLLTGLIDRVEGLALWQGLRLDADFRALKELARSIDVNDREVEHVGWERKSGRHRRHIPMRDARGQLTLTGDLGPLLPYLLIGETTQIGGDTRHGHGWYGAAFFG